MMGEIIAWDLVLVQKRGTNGVKRDRTCLGEKKKHQAKIEIKNWWGISNFIVEMEKAQCCECSFGPDRVDRCFMIHKNVPPVICGGSERLARS